MLSRAAGRALFAHAWPFHVRELEQTLRAAVAIAAGPRIERGDLRLWEYQPAQPAAADPLRERLVAALEKYGGNLSAVARALVTSRSQVQRLLARYSLSGAPFKRR
jgi:transcriptional regulator of acetoin/glycerol metabolism